MEHWILDLLDQAFHAPAWHGPNLSATLRGLDPQAAAWRPATGRHSPWEIALHCAYWKHRVLRRLARDARHPFPRRGEDWPELPAEISAEAWRTDLDLLKRTHAELRAAAAGLSPGELERPGPGQKRTRLENLIGIACHDVYHAGQVRLIRRMSETGLAHARKQTVGTTRRSTG